MKTNSTAQWIGCWNVSLHRSGFGEAALGPRSTGSLRSDLDLLLEGRHCVSWPSFGHSRDDKGHKPQIVFGLLTNAVGCPVAVEVWEGNTADPQDRSGPSKETTRTLWSETAGAGGRSRHAHQRPHSRRLLRGQRHQLTARRCATSIQKLAADDAGSPSLFDTVDLAEITHPDYPGERLVACFNPILSEERARKREDLLQATEKELEKDRRRHQTQAKRPLRGKHTIGLV